MIFKKKFTLQYIALLLVYSVLILCAFNIRSILDFVNTSIMYLQYACLTVMIMTGVHLIICKLLYTLSFNAAVTIYDYIIHTIISIVFFSSIAYIVCALSFSKSIAIFVCSMIWIYFMVNIDSTSLINPFYYVGDPNSSAVHMYGQSMISLVLIIVTGYIRLQRPFFFKQ